VTPWARDAPPFMVQSPAPFIRLLFGEMADIILQVSVSFRGTCKNRTSSSGFPESRAPSSTFLCADLSVAFLYTLESGSSNRNEGASTSAQVELAGFPAFLLGMEIEFITQHPSRRAGSRPYDRSQRRRPRPPQGIRRLV